MIEDKEGPESLAWTISRHNQKKEIKYVGCLERFMFPLDALQKDMEWLVFHSFTSNINFLLERPIEREHFEAL